MRAIRLDHPILLHIRSSLWNHSKQEHTEDMLKKNWPQLVTSPIKIVLIDLHNKWPCASSGVATNLMHLHPNKTNMIHEFYKHLATVSSVLRYKPWCQAIQILKCQRWLRGGLMWTICYPCAMYAICKNTVLSIRVPIPSLFEISFYLRM